MTKSRFDWAIKQVSETEVQVRRNRLLVGYVRYVGKGWRIYPPSDDLQASVNIYPTAENAIRTRFDAAAARIFREMNLQLAGSVKEAS